MSALLRALSAAIAALALGLSVAACGGKLTDTEFRAKADDICRSEQQRFATVQADLPANLAEQVTQADALITISTDVLGQLRELDPPDDLADPFQNYLLVRERGLGLLVKGRDAAKARDREGYQAAQLAANDKGAERRKVAESIGLKTCGPATATDSKANPKA